MLKRENVMLRSIGRKTLLMVVVVCVLAAMQAQAATVDLLVVSYSGGGSGTGKVLRYDGDTGAFIGNFATGLSAPQPINQGSSKAGYDVFVGDNAGVYRFDKDTGAPLGLFADTASNVVAMTFGPDGDLFTGRFSGPNSIIDRWDGATGASLGQFATFANDSIADMIFGLADGNLYVVISGHSIQKFDKTTGANLGTFVADPAVGAHAGLIEGLDGHLYASVGQSGDDRVIKYHGTTGATLADPFFTGGLTVQRLAIGPDNSFYMTDFSANNVLKFSAAGANQGVFASGSGLSQPIGLTFLDPNIPEPAVLPLLSLGLGGLMTLRRRR